jgi:hypothetical protein
MKGSISEFELGIIRSRMYEAARSKAKRGELRIPPYRSATPGIVRWVSASIRIADCKR